MEPAKDLRKEVMEMIETADEKVIRMVHAMLEIDAAESWEDTLPSQIKSDLQTASQESENGEGISDEEVRKNFKQWFAK